MLYQIIIAVGLIVCTLNIVFNLRALRTPKSNSKIPDPAPFVSVLIPARNEETNIETCLKSLQKQDYPNFEILVLDDNSTDSTADIVRRIATTDSRIQLIRGEQLPEGWAGKPFACQQLAERANGSWLMFVDADTIHASHMIRSVLALALELDTSLLSGFPRQLAVSLPQKVGIPVLYFIIMSWLPLWWTQRSKKPKPSLAIGQFLLFRKEEYWQIGGHKAVKDKILEDVWLGVEINRHGGRHVAINLSSLVWCNMYRNVGAMWEGFVKWMYSVSALSPAALVGLMIAGYFFFLAPFYWLCNDLFLLAAPADWRFVVIFQIAIIIFMRWLVDSYFKEPIVSAILHPLGFSFLFASALYAGSRQVIGKGVQWKDRLYGATSGVK